MKNIAVWLVVVVLVGAGSFYGGMKYDQSRTQSAFQNLGNLTPAQRQQRLAQFGAGAGANGGRQGRGNFGNGVAGQILSKDANSITVKSQDGSSRIVLYSGSTKVSKSVDGTLDELQQGEQINANGTSNSDGSITAQTIQIRPAPAASSSASPLPSN